MPGVLYHPITRRNFLRHAARAAAACTLVGEFATGTTRADGPSDTLHFALLSDTHVAADPKAENRKFLPWDNLQRAVSEAAAGSPEAAILDGDAARLTGELQDYEAVRKLLGPLAEKCPIYIGMGNHDSRENFEKVFTSDAPATQKIKDKHVLVVEKPILRVIVLDSLLYPNKTPGLLGKAQRDWLDRYLASADSRATVIFVHHTLGDEDGELLDAPALFRIVRPYRKVKAIFYGHSHQYSYGLDDGIHLVNLPAVGYNFADKEPVGWVDARFSPHGVDLTLKAFGGNREKDGQTKSLTWR